MSRYEESHTEEFEGFTITFSAAPEETDPRGDFMTEDGEDDEDTLDKIADGTYAWFQARVTASRAGVVLGEDYLGGCCYDQPSAFVTEDGYYPDMRATAVEAARAKLAELAL